MSTSRPDESRASVVAALTIAGSDSGGGAGIQADLRTFFAHDVLGCTAITALTAQNTVEVRAVEAVTPAMVAAQVATVLDDLPVRAAKTGMLANAAIVRAVAGALAARPGLPLVVDPVITSSSGTRLLDDAGVSAVREVLLPRAAVITPNRAEALILAGLAGDASAEALAEALARLAPSAAVIVTGGEGAGAEAVDVVRYPDGRVERLTSVRVATRATHGTGCTFSAAIAARLARGEAAPDAIVGAKAYVAGAIAAAQEVGAGHGPVDHLWETRVRD